MAHCTIPLSDLKVGMYLIGVDRSGFTRRFSGINLKSVRNRKSTRYGRRKVGIMGSITPGKALLSLVYLCRDAKKVSCAPLQEFDLSLEPEGGRSIRDIRELRGEGIDVKAILRQVAA